MHRAGDDGDQHADTRQPLKHRDNTRGGWLRSGIGAELCSLGGSGTRMLREHPGGPVWPQLLLILGVSEPEHLSPLLGMWVEVRTSLLIKGIS